MLNPENCTAGKKDGIPIFKKQLVLMVSGNTVAAKTPRAVRAGSWASALRPQHGQIAGPCPLGTGALSSASLLIDHEVQQAGRPSFSYTAVSRQPLWSSIITC